MATVTVEYFGVNGTGRNVTEAKRDAGRKIEAFVKESSAPKIMQWRGWAILYWRDIDGWCSAIIAERGALRDQTYLSFGCHAQDDRELVESSIRLRLAQFGWKPEDGTDCELLKTVRERDEFRRWAEFQLRYCEARERGMSEQDAYDWAGRNPARRDLWETTPAVAG